ncbi:MAG: ABC transporter ATP-binding protein [bacterium]|nr:ABC transporter ATP-binding protein [bacterium]
MMIETKGVTKRLGETSILKGINLNVRRNQLTGILGPNGSGKSTFLKCIYRTLKPDSGVILLDNKSLEQMKIKESAKKIAVLEQQNHYNFDFTVEEIVLMGRSPHKKLLEQDNKKDYEIVWSCLKEVGLEQFNNRIFSTLSGGEQQRVILARALAQETECLILDEPTNHLDIRYQLEVMELVKRKELTVFAAIHDLNIAAMYCDYLYLMKDGTIIAEGQPKDVLTAEYIKQVYEINTTIYTDENEQIHILYHAT